MIEIHRQYVEWVERMGRQYWLDCPPLFTDRNPETGAKLELLLHEGRIQIERVTHEPFNGSPMHRHPDVDTCEFPLYGGGRMVLRKRNFILDDSVVLFRPLFISRKCFHGGVAAGLGGSFISVQYWYTDYVTSIRENWEEPEERVRVYA